MQRPGSTPAGPLEPALMLTRVPASMTRAETMPLS